MIISFSGKFRKARPKKTSTNLKQRDKNFANVGRNQPPFFANISRTRFLFRLVVRRKEIGWLLACVFVVEQKRKAALLRRKNYFEQRRFKNRGTSLTSPYRVDFQSPNPFSRSAVMVRCYCGKREEKRKQTKYFPPTTLRTKNSSSRRVRQAKNNPENKKVVSSHINRRMHNVCTTALALDAKLYDERWLLRNKQASLCAYLKVIDKRRGRNLIQYYRTNSQHTVLHERSFLRRGQVAAWRRERWQLEEKSSRSIAMFMLAVHSRQHRQCIKLFSEVAAAVLALIQNTSVCKYAEFPAKFAFPPCTFPIAI